MSIFRFYRDGGGESTEEGRAGAAVRAVSESVRKKILRKGRGSYGYDTCVDGERFGNYSGLISVVTV